MTGDPTRRIVLEGAAASVAALALPMPARGEAAPRGQMLWYRQPAASWTEALPVGNGRLGAMVFGGTGSERLQLNEDTLWTGGPYDPVNPAAHDALPEVRRLIDAGAFAAAQALANATLMGVPKTQMAYQPLGDLLLDMPGLDVVTAYRRDLTSTPQSPRPGLPRAARGFAATCLPRRGTRWSRCS